MEKKCKDCIFYNYTEPFGRFLCQRRPYLKINSESESCDDEFYPKPDKKSKPNQYGWINIYRYGKSSQVGVEIFKTEEEALTNIVDGTYIDTVKIIWRDSTKNQI